MASKITVPPSNALFDLPARRVSTSGSVFDAAATTAVAAAVADPAP
jgi:hypothetical protein